MSISDQALAAGCVPNVERFHGDRIQVLSGADAGKWFTAVIENQPDDVFAGLVGDDPRGKRFIRFVTPPNISRMDVIKTPDGRTWNCAKSPDADYLTNDFELIEIK